MLRAGGEQEFAGDTNDLFLEEMQAAEAARNEQQRKQDMQACCSLT